MARTFDSFLSLGVTIGAVVILVVSITVFERYYADRVNPHISVDGIALGGVALADAPAYLQRKVAERNNQAIQLHVGDSTYHVTSKQFHARYDVQPALASAMADGHDADLFSRLYNQIITMIQGHNYTAPATHDQRAVERYIAGLDGKVTVQPLPAVVGIKHNEVAILREPKPGRRIDRAPADRLLGQIIDSHVAFNVTVPLQITGSPITHEVAQAAVDQGQALLSQPTYFSSGTKIRAWYLTPTQLVRLLTFKTRYDPRKSYAIVVGINQKRLRETMVPIAAAVDHPPSPARYIVAEGSGGQPDSAVPQPDGPGLAIDTNKTAQAILSAASSDHTVIIPYVHPHAAFDLQAARALRLDLEMSRAPTTLLTSSALRTGNARAAAAALDNIRLNPGQVLSVTGVISPVVKANGYTLDLNQLAKQDISGVNGGTTQVASTLFQAAYAAGLPILSRTPYPYVTRFNGTIGADAMVVDRTAGPDLQFVNDTKHVLLINVVVYKDHVTAYMFNSSEAVHRTVKLIGPSVTINQDGSVDALLSRTITGDTNSQDAISSHYSAADPYP